MAFIKNWIRKGLRVLVKNLPEHELLLRYPGIKITGHENIRIGERVSIASNVTLHASSPIVIGNDTMIGTGAILTTSTHSYKNNPMWKEQIARPIDIGENVWIGANAIILPGLKIGNYSVIGAGSVITRHVPEKAIVAGNPARIIKYRDLPPADSSNGYPGVVVQGDFLPQSLVMKTKPSN